MALNVKEQLEAFPKSLIIDELHNVLNTQQIAKLINNLQQRSAEDPNEPKANGQSTLTGQELDDKILNLMDQLNIPKKSRGSILKMSEPQKNIMISQYEKQLQSKTSKDSLTAQPKAERKVSEDRRNTFIMPDKKEVIIQGWLHKRSGFGSNYKKRWFVLYHNNMLAYYVKPELAKSNKANPKGEISLYEVTDLVKKARIDDKAGNKYKFELVTQGKTFILKSEDANPYYSWINRITQRVNPTIICKGWAVKRGNVHKTWNKRYFALVNYEKVYSELRYYEDEKMKKFKGMIDIMEIKDISSVCGKAGIKKYGKGHPNCLELQTTGRLYVLGFKTVDKVNGWKDEITRSKFDDDITQHISNPVFEPGVGGKGLSVLSEAATSVSLATDDDDAKKSEIRVTRGMSDRLGVNPLHDAMGKSSSIGSYDDTMNSTEDEEEPEQEHVEDEESDDGILKGVTEDFGLDITEDNGGGLPRGWTEHRTEDGNSYYHNESTGVTQWEIPE